MSSTHSAIARMWELLQLLPDGPPGMTAAEARARLASAGYEVSKRTIERDLIELSRLFPLQCNNEGASFCSYRPPGESASLPGISISEARTRKLLESCIPPLSPEWMLTGLESRFIQAEEKLE